MSLRETALPPLTAALLTAAACGPASPPPSPPALRVEHAGCELVFRGSACAPGEERRLALWIATAPGAELQIDGRPAGEPEAAVDGGRRFRREIPPGQDEVVVESQQGGAGSRWTLRLAELPGLAWYRQARRLGREGDAAAATRLAEGQVRSSDAIHRGLALGLLGRLEYRQGRPDLAGRHFQQALAAHRETGSLSGEVSDSLMLLRLALDRHDFAAARDLLAALPEAAGDGELAFQAELNRGLLNARTGDLRSALRSLGEAAAGARRVGLGRRQVQAEEVLARLLQRLGRFEESAALFARLLAESEDLALTPCDRVELLNNQAWAWLLAREAGRELSRQGADPKLLLEEALGLLATGCPTLAPSEGVNLRLNLALAHLQEGRVELAGEWLEQARALSPTPPPELMLWAWDIDARLQLAAGRPREALARYRELARRAGDLLSPEAEWRLAFGRARSLAALGDVPEAVDAFAAAEALLDREILLVPMHEGRETFVAEREQATRRHLDLLHRAGRDAEALAVARRARSRVLRSLRRFTRLEGLSPADREALEGTTAAYGEQRAALDAAAAASWRLPDDLLARAVATEAAAFRRLRDELDKLLARLDGEGEPSLAPPLPGEILLAYYPGLDGWLGFAADGGGVVGRRLGDLEGLAGEPGGSADLARRLLGPFAAGIRSAQRVRVLPYGPLKEVDFHALPFDGEPLVAGRPVVYGLDLPQAQATDGEVAAPPRRKLALLVSDPGGELPWAREETRQVSRSLAAAWPGWQQRPLRGGEATREAILSLLPEADLLHYAGHARHAGWDSSLPLAAGSRLTLDDLMTLERAPAWVVLAGCETSAPAGESPLETLALAHAFLAAGSRAVVATPRVLADEASAALLAALYEHWRPGVAIEAALRQAQLSRRAADPAADWAGFRVLVP